jgi:hypothetical protein
MEPDISILRKTGHFYFALTTSHFGASIMRVLNILDSPFSLDANGVAAYIPNSLASLHL